MKNIYYKCKDGFFIVGSKHKEIQLKEPSGRFIKRSFGELSSKKLQEIIYAMYECFKAKEKQND